MSKRTVKGEKSSIDSGWVSLSLKCGHTEPWPIWKNIKGPNYRPKRVTCHTCKRNQAHAQTIAGIRILEAD